MAGASQGKREGEESKGGNCDCCGGKKKNTATAGRATTVKEATSGGGGQDGTAKDQVQVEDVGLRNPALDQDQDGVLEEHTAASPLVQEDQDNCLGDPTKLLLQVSLLSQFMKPSPRLAQS